MPSRSAGMAIVIAGVIVVAIGLLVMTGALNWFGRLPGDIRVERPNMRVYAPIASMLLVSLVLSAAVYLVRRAMGR